MDDSNNIEIKVVDTNTYGGIDYRIYITPFGTYLFDVAFPITLVEQISEEKQKQIVGEIPIILDAVFEGNLEVLWVQKEVADYRCLLHAPQYRLPDIFNLCRYFPINDNVFRTMLQKFKEQQELLSEGHNNGMYTQSPGLAFDLIKLLIIGFLNNLPNKKALFVDTFGKNSGKCTLTIS